MTIIQPRRVTVGGPSDQIISILAYEGLADREKMCGAFLGDPERVARFAETERNGPLVRRPTAQMLRPTAYSPRQYGRRRTRSPWE